MLHCYGVGLEGSRGKANRRGLGSQRMKPKKHEGKKRGIADEA